MIYICVARTEKFPVKIVMRALRNLFRVKSVRFTRSGKSFDLACDHRFLYHVAPRPGQGWRNFFMAHAQIVGTSRRNSFACRSMSLLLLYVILHGEILSRVEA